MIKTSGFFGVLSVLLGVLVILGVFSEAENKKILLPTQEIKPQATTVETIPSIKQDENKFYTVTGVVDGDTIKVQYKAINETIRIIGLNTPETADPRKEVECFGREASNYAKELLVGKTVVLENDPTQGERDKYGRLLRYIFLPTGEDYGKIMISKGYGYEYIYDKPYRYQSAYKTAQSQAQATEQGLWASSTCNGNS